MAKGVKKIRQTAGEYYAGMSNSTMLTLKGNVASSFSVTEWEPGTTAADKKSLVWMLETVKRDKVLMEQRVPELSQILIPKKNCGDLPVYYLEAALENKIDKKRQNGLLIRGFTPPLIVKSTWSSTANGPSLKTTPISYGDTVYLKIETEGLNGNNLIIELGYSQFNKIHIIRNIAVQCVNGEVNLCISNTYEWFDLLKYGPYINRLLIRVKDTTTNKLIKDSFDDEVHARFLRIEKKISQKTTQPVTNVVVAKVGEKLPAPIRVDHCKFTKIVIQDKDPVTIFDEGKIKDLGRLDKPFFLEEKISYDFDSYKLNAQAKTILNKMASTLMELPYVPVQLGSHTDNYGTDQYNLELSRKRAQTAMEYLISRNVDASRITSKGFGKTMLVDKTPGLSKEKSIVNRRTTISLQIFTHNAQALTFETIQPGISYKKTLPIEVSDFKTDGLCRMISNPHRSNVPFSEIAPSNKKDMLGFKGNVISPMVYSPMDNTMFAFDYFFPHLRAPNNFFFYINSCAYFSDKDNYSLVVKAYSDIKWTFEFFLNLSDPLNIGWKGAPHMTDAKIKELKDAAKKIRKNKEDGVNEIEWGAKLSAKWNNSGGEYHGKDEYSIKIKSKIEKLFKLMSKLQKLTKGITKKTGGADRKLKFGTNTPMIVRVLAPKVALKIEWTLARGQKNRKKTEKIGTEFTVTLASEPLIGVSVTIDLLMLVIQGASMSFTGNPVAGDILLIVLKWAQKGYESSRATVSFDMYINLVLTGTIEGNGSVKINTASDVWAGDAQLKGHLTGKLEAGVSLKAKAILVEASSPGGDKVDLHATAKAGAEATVGINFVGGFKYDTDDGLGFKPLLMMDACVAKVLVLIEVGLTVYKVSADWKPVNYERKRTFWEAFDIMEELAALGGDTNSSKVEVVPKKAD